MEAELRKTGTFKSLLAKPRSTLLFLGIPGRFFNDPGYLDFGDPLASLFSPASTMTWVLISLNIEGSVV